MSNKGDTKMNIKARISPGVVFWEEIFWLMTSSKDRSTCYV